MTTDAAPNLVALAGPNGAGKSTAGPVLLKETLQITEFVNADLIAQGLSPFDPAGAALAAGRIMLERIHDLGRRRLDFAFETTLAGRSYARWIRELTNHGYRFHIIFLWLPSPEHAIARVADRVRRGGHHVPDQVVRRRYHAGLKNFFRLYQPLASTWRFYDSSGPSLPRLIARGGRKTPTRTLDEDTWRLAKRGIRDES